MTKNAEKNARAMLSRLSTEQLIKEFDMTEAIPISLELSMVRGWIMDELEKRNPEAFDKPFCAAFSAPHSGSFAVIVT